MTRFAYLITCFDGFAYSTGLRISDQVKITYVELPHTRVSFIEEAFTQFN
jgi:hypothetical protein